MGIGLTRDEYEEEIVEWQNAIDKLSEKIVDATGTCPCDMEDWEHPKGCSSVCVNQYAHCWQLWAKGEGE